ncbi:MAG: [acyl-carrier-protein] S-malonyltransferase [Actinobacteria bacterium ATB1]|nr:[acyl-carrier-protein] S-malonyltransferase [Actinobacteria bacterium ATB1]
MIAFLFPGQGSQKSGMGRPWVEEWPDLFELASDASGMDVRRLVCDAEDDELRSTDNAQLATCVCSIAAWKSLVSEGLTPAVVAGHSLGEYTALVAAGAVAADDAVRLVIARGRGMAEAAERSPGTMTALIGADVDLAEAACREAAGTVVVANVNASDQVVISGEEPAIARAADTAKSMGAKRAIPLRVGGAFHSPLMAPALPSLAAAISTTTFVDTAVPIVTNVDACRHSDADELTPLLLAQLCSPVLWQQTMELLIDLGVRGFVEVGPGGVLKKLAQRAAKGSAVLGIESPDDVSEAASTLAGVAPALPDTAFGSVPDLIDLPVVSPAAGRFRAEDIHAYTAEGEYVQEGQIIGQILTASGPVPVQVDRGGWVMHVLAGSDIDVAEGQPLVTIRPF